MKRLFATLAVATMMFAAPNAALAGGGGKPSKGDETCTSRGANKGGTCNVTVIEGDDDGDGKIEIGESFCNNKANGKYLVNAQVVVCIGGIVVDVL